MMGWIATIFSVAGFLLIARKKIIGWPVWSVSSVLWIIFGCIKHEPSIVVSNTIFLCLNLHGWYEWSSAKTLADTKAASRFAACAGRFTKRLASGSKPISFVLFAAITGRFILRKLHLVRPDLIPYPIDFPIFC